MIKSRHFHRAVSPLAYLGLVPGERSSGEDVRRAGITKIGMPPMPGAPMEGAWTFRMKARIGRHKVGRIETLPKIVGNIG